MGRDDDLNARIQRRAYQLWEAEGRPSGRAMEHWLSAEAEIKRQLPAPFTPKPPARLPPRDEAKSKAARRRR